MLWSYLKITLRVLRRRKFFTFVSLFGISFTLMVLLVVAAQLDHQLVPQAPEGRFGQVLTLTRVHMYGEKSDWQSGPGYRLIDRHCRGLKHVQALAIKYRGEQVTSFIGGQKVDSRLCYVNADYWRVLDFEFLAGHSFDKADVMADRRVVVIDERTRRRFFPDVEAVGQSLVLGTRTFQVVGVVPTVSVDFEMASANMWAPLTSNPQSDWRETMMSGYAAAFLVDSPGHFDAVKEEFKKRMTQIEYPDPDRFHTTEAFLLTRLERVSQGMVGNIDGPAAVTQALLMVLGASLLFMSLPAINLININLSRIWDRNTEIGVRKAFGASSTDLVGQFVVENVVLSILGGIIGLALAGIVLALIPSLVPEHVVINLSLNWRIFGYALVLAAFFGLLSGVWPAWRMARQHPVDALRGGLR